MEKEKVLEELKQINYPGFNRDIVSFGMVKDITVDNDIVTLELSISSQNEEKKQEVIKSVKQKLSNHFTKVEVILKADANTASSPKQSPAPTPILDNVKHVIAIASGKGGVGKSTIATNLACALSKKGGKIGLLDLDIYGPSLPILLGVNEQPKMTDDNKLIPIKKFGSQGQQKSFLIALKLAQFEYLKNKTGNSPILLLDDIFDKLDLIRVKRIVEIVNSTNFGQLFLSDTDRERIEKVLSSLNLSSKIFDV